MAVHEQPLQHTRTLRVPRSRGAVSGILLILLGIWGALIALVGPYFNYSYGTDQTWHWSAARFWLEVLPGGVTALGGLMLLLSANRIIGSLGGWLATAGGAWFVVGLSLAPLLRIGEVGAPLSTTNGGRAAAELGYFYALGAVIMFVAAFALGRLAVVGVRDLRAAQQRDQADRDRAELERAELERAELERARLRERPVGNGHHQRPETDVDESPTAPGRPADAGTAPTTRTAAGPTDNEISRDRQQSDR
ncbi:MAG: hypothetical protein QOE89_1170 [Pseudonocardiales bacterium]|nr:hypothetical protein [Pseudonocardiales bacterium]